MEENLISWILKEDIFIRERIIKSIKKISDRGIHITIDSLSKFLYKKTKTIFLNGKEIDFKETLKLEIENNELLNQLQPLFEMYENINIVCCNFVYNRTHLIFKKHIKQVNNRLDSKNIAIGENNQKEILDSIFNILDSCFHIIDNNKKLLIKNDFNILKNNKGGGGNLFLKIWKNIVIRNEILKYIKLFKIHQFKMIFSSISKLDAYPFKEYLYNVQLEIGEKNNDVFNYLLETMEINDYLENNLPDSVSVLNIIDLSKEFSNGYCRYIRPSSIPCSVKVLNFIKQADYLKSTKFCKLIQTKNNNSYFISGDNINNNNNNVFLENEKSAYVISNSEQVIPDGVDYVNYEFNLEERSYIFLTFNNLPNTVKTLEIKRKLSSKLSLQLNEDSICLLPNTIKKLSFDLVSILRPKFLPLSITELYLGNAQNVYTNSNDNDNEYLIEKGILPPQLRKLNLGGYSNEIKKGILPPTLTSLTLCTTYKKPIKPGCLPQSLQYLSFRGDVISAIDQQKNCSMYGEFSNKELSFSSISSLFSTVNNLVLNYNSKQQKEFLIGGSIPIGLKTLKLSNHQPYQDILVKGILTPLHSSLTSISIIDTISRAPRIYQKKNEKLQKLKQHFFIPSSVKKFVGSVDNHSYSEICQILPFTKVKNLSFNPICLKFSKSLKSLYFKHSLNFNSIVWPQNTITSLTLEGQYTDSLSSFPKSLTFLDLTNDTFCSINSVSLEHFFPCLKTLILGKLFNAEIDIESSFPNLVTLVVGNSTPKLVIPSTTTTNLGEIIVFNTNIQFLNDNILKLQPFIKIYNHSIKKKILKNLFIKN
ncbi:hypothetical protein ACTFIY_010891 [Dictyostelium cf. discoideum]